MAFAASAALVLSACPGRGGGGGDDDDDDDNGGACGFAACGGDAVGDWGIVDSCVTFETAPPEDCPTAEASYGTPDLSGTLSIDGAGTYTLSTQMAFDLTIDFPTSCLEGMTCDQIEANLVGSFPGSSCATSGVGCACTTPFSQSADETGTWEVDGNILHVVDDGGDPEDLEYCASAGTLQIRSTTDDGGTLEMILEPR